MDLARAVKLRRNMVMTDDDALALLFLSLDGLTHRRICRSGPAVADPPVGPIKEALAHLDERGADTGTLREMFHRNGLDLSGAPPAQDVTLRHPQDQKKVTSSGRQYPRAECNKVQEEKTTPSPLSYRSKIPDVIAETIWAKFQARWSKSHIAREFRLNRRTVIRICAGR